MQWDSSLLHSAFRMGCHGMSALHSVAPAKIPAARVTIIDERMQSEDSSRSSVVFSAFSFLPSLVWTKKVCGNGAMWVSWEWERRNGGNVKVAVGVCAYTWLVLA